MNKALLVIQASTYMTQEQQDKVFEMVRPVAQLLGAELIVSDASTSVAIHQDLAPLVAAVQQQTRKVQELIDLQADREPSYVQPRDRTR